jgi:hypothetical protein
MTYVHERSYTRSLTTHVSSPTGNWLTLSNYGVGLYTWKPCKYSVNTVFTKHGDPYGALPTLHALQLNLSDQHGPIA